VENLYFHHSHLRGPKLFPAPPIIATHQHATSFVGSSTSSVQSSLSFKLATSSLGRNPISASSLQGYDQSKNNTSNEDANAANHAQQSFPSNDYTTNIDPSLTPDSMEVDIEDAQVALTLPTPPSQTGTDHPMPLRDQIDVVGLTSPPRNSKSPIDPAPPFTSSHVTVKPQRGLSQKVLPAPKALPTLSTKDMFSSSLTYDSFWSSHTGLTTPQSRQGPHSDITTDYAPTFQTSGSDYNNTTSYTILLRHLIISSRNQILIGNGILVCLRSICRYPGLYLHLPLCHAIIRIWSTRWWRSG
jgi:hypothetical protein